MLKLYLVFSFLLSACATKYDHLGTNLEQLRPELSDSYSFAFLYKGNKYFFAPKYFKQGNRECYLYLGFKNDKLDYAFSRGVFSALENGFSQNDTPETIMRLIVESVADELPTANRCFELGQGPPPDSGQGEALIAILFPITIPLGAYAFVVDQIDKNFRRKVSNSIHLDMDRNELPEFLQKKLQLRTKGNYPYYEYLEGHFKMIMYFESNKLKAWSQSYAK